MHALRYHDAGAPVFRSPRLGWRARVDDDEQLVALARTGRRDAFAELIRRFHRDVRNVALAMLADPSLTENVVQQTFVNAFRALDQYRDGEGFRRWVQAIARNLIRDELRRARRESGRLALYREYLITKLDNHEAAQERDEALRQALVDCREKLGGDAVLALELRYEQGLGFEEIAARLGRSGAASRQLMTRVRIALKTCIERRLGET